jgi:uncharacterized protein YndB with AHSA1/START domain
MEVRMVEDISKQAVVSGPLEAVWDAWTTVEGLKFISQRSRVELEPDGAYEWFLDLEPDRQGRRGGEGARLLVVIPHELLAFTWTFPPSVESLRFARETTRVVVRFESVDAQTTSVRLDVTGWEQGEDWAEGRRYFDRAWDIVLQRLTDAFE